MKQMYHSARVLTYAASAFLVIGQVITHPMALRRHGASIDEDVANIIHADSDAEEQR
jgi:hypothetical protein